MLGYKAHGPIQGATSLQNAGRPREPKSPTGDVDDLEVVQPLLKRPENVKLTLLLR